MGGEGSLNNSGTIAASLGATFSSPGATVYYAAASNDLINSGNILASGAADGVYAASDYNNIQNSGTISSAATAVLLKNGGDSLVNDGSILSTGPQAVEIDGALGGSSVQNFGLISTATDNGSGVSIDGDGNHVYNFGTILGGVTLVGNYEALTNRGDIVGDIDFSGDYGTYRGGGTGFESGRVIVGGSHGMYNGSIDGTTFLIGATTLASTDTFNGKGVGTLEFGGAGTISPDQLANVTGFDDIVLGPTDQITITEDVADTALNQKMLIETAGNNKIKLNSVTSTTDRFVVSGKGGGDTIVAGASFVKFQFQEVSDSTGPTYDILKNVNYALDKFDIPGGAGTIAAINAPITTGSLSTSTFNTDLAADLGPRLGAHDAVLFTASGGTLAGDTFLVIDINGTAGYQANADLVMQIVGSTGSLTTANFV